VRLPPRDGERIERSRTIRFRFGSREVEAFAGDSIGSALYAGGVRVFSRSFKYHRPRGLVCCRGNCASCLMTVDGVPNVRVCVEPAREGAIVAPQNVWGSLERDLLGVVDKLGDRFLPVGFYYRTMIRPRRAWPLYERALRSVAGLGEVGGARRRVDVEHLHARVLVIGGGRSGRAAAARAAAGGPGVVLVDDRDPTPLDGVELLAPATALAIYEGGLVPVDAGGLLYRVRAEHIVVATGTLEQPLVFPGNDLVGVMLPDAVRRLARDWSIAPGRRAVVIAAGDDGLDAAHDLAEAGVEVAEVVDLRHRPVQHIEARGKRGRVTEVLVDGDKFAVDMLVAAGARQPAYSLLAQAGARVEYDPRRGIFVPTALPAGVEAVGSVTGAGREAAVPQPTYAGAGSRRAFVCFCEDVTEKDVARSVAEGFDSIELAKRYATVTMGPCQGKLCHLASIRLCARETGSDEHAIGTTTARPPWRPVELGTLVGPRYEPTRRTSLHERHLQAGATMMWAGRWRRPSSYGDVEREVRAVHEALGVIDVSTLGKIVVAGPDAAALLDRLYPNRLGDLAPGRIRYGVLTTDGGRIIDDGTVARLADDVFYVTTTSSGSDAVVEWFEWWNAIWGYEVDVVDVTGALAAINVAGPRAREALGALTSHAVTNDAVAYLDARELGVAGVPCLALRIGFVGELGYELHVPATAGGHVWDALVGQGAVPFGVEAQRVLRLEKSHVIVGQDTDSESNLVSAGMPWLARLDKDDDFVGRWAVEHVQERGVRERLVGFTMANGSMPAEGAQVVANGAPAGRVTSVRRSERVGSVIGLAWVAPEQAEDGGRLDVRVGGRLERATVTLAPFYDAGGERLRS
jgi:sarcosine oxidase subunit alpha